MNRPQRLNVISQYDIVKTFGGDWFSSFIKKSITPYSESNESLKIDFFKDGKSFNYEVEKFKSCSDPSLLPCSVRLTNIQLVVPEVLKMCQVLERTYNKLFTCNLYYTPGPERNCFDFHVDQQLTYVCQIMGSKNWIFPTENDECLAHLENKTFLAEQVREKSSLQELLNPGDHIMVPYGVIHKVEIYGTSPSLHFTFGSYEHTQDMMIQNFISLALQESGLNKEINKNLNQNDMTEILSKFKKSISDLSSDDFIREYEGKVRAEEFRVMKQGRLYKKDPSTNQD